MKNHTYKEIKNIYGKISPFEFKDKLIDIAKYTAKENNRELLDAGRGNQTGLVQLLEKPFYFWSFRYY